jgi:hypothetical protein
MNTFIFKDGQQLGPFSDARIQAGIEGGEFDLNDLGKRDDFGHWLPLSEILAPSNPTTSSPPIPQAGAPDRPVAPLPAASRLSQKNMIVLIVAAIVAALLYPIVYFFGLLAGMQEMIAKSGSVKFANGLVAQYFEASAGSVTVSVISVSGSNPDKVAVDFENRQTRAITSSQILDARVTQQGMPYFSFQIPKGENATIRRP